MSSTHTSDVPPISTSLSTRVPAFPRLTVVKPERRVAWTCETWTENSMRFISYVSVHVWIKMYRMLRAYFHAMHRALSRSHFYPIPRFLTSYSGERLLNYFVRNRSCSLILDRKRKEYVGHFCGGEREMGLASDINSRCDYSYGRQFWHTVGVRRCIFKHVRLIFVLCWFLYYAGKREVAVHA